jgi:pimeloyl-ACP methyl ester carboxylesterase
LPSFTTPDGVRLDYRLEGQGPLLVCHPGGPGRAVDYLGNLGGLDADRTLVLLDQRGCGRSGSPDDPTSYTPEQLARDVESLREHLGVETIELLGHSAGGKVVQIYADTYPHRLSALVVVCSWVGGWRDDAQDRADIYASRAAEPWYPEAIEAVEAMEYARPSERARLEDLTRPFWYGRWDETSRQHAATASAQMNLRFAVVFARTPVPELTFDGLACPVLVVGGGRDALTVPERSFMLAKALPRARVEIIPAAGHFPWVDEPEAFRTAVAGFLG